MAEYTIDKIEYGGNVYKLQDSVSGYGTGTITGVKTTAGAHTTIDVSSGNANFNVPTKTSHLTNDSGFITSDSDKKLEVAEASNGIYYPIFGTGTTAATRQYDTIGLSYSVYGGSANVIGSARIVLGNNKISTATNNKEGQIELYGSTSYSTIIRNTVPGPAANREIYLPDKTGTIALTSDIPTVPSNIVNTITTTAGTHTVISSQKGNVSFNVPTKTSHLTNDSGFITTYTDEKVKLTAVTSGTTYYPIVGTGTTAATRQFDTTGFSYIANSIRSLITLGNNISEGTTGSKRGAIQIYGTTDRYTQLETLITSTGAGQATGVVVNFPNKGGTIALTDDIPTVPSITLNGSSTTSPSFYAPTGAGTSGQYLKSSGSGAPTWTNFPTIPSITLNGSSTTSPSFYAPTGAGTSGQYLKSNGSGAPSWTSFPTIVNTRGTPTSGGTTLSVVNTGDMYTWNNKAECTNLVNGSSTGSLRATGTSTEDSNYTIGSYAFAEGQYTKAKGPYSHASGYESITGTNASMAHAQGFGTIASKMAQTTLGTFNIEDTSSTTTHPGEMSEYGEYAVIIGNGTTDSGRSNALTIDWQGRIECGDYSGIFRSIFNIFYPVGSYYETHLASTIPSGESTPTEADLANLGVTWFDPNYAWGGTWLLETAGQVHVSASGPLVIGEGTYHVSGASSNTSDGGAITKSYTPGGSIGNTTLNDAQIAHGHGFTQPKVPQTAANVYHAGEYVSIDQSVSWGTGALASGSTYKYLRSTTSPSAGVARTTPTIPQTTCTGGAVSNLSGASSTRTAHGHTWTGTAASINVMQPYIIVYRWHRTA